MHVAVNDVEIIRCIQIDTSSPRYQARQEVLMGSFNSLMEFLVEVNGIFASKSPLHCFLINLITLSLIVNSFN